jgi:hypothetical protein
MMFLQFMIYAALKMSDNVGLGMGIKGKIRDYDFF